MRTKLYYIGFQTILMREIIRFARTWIQTLLPPFITSMLYFIIFGHFIGARVGTIDSTPYIDYIAPGLIMMSVITNSYANVSSSIFLAKFQKNIEELLVSPLPNFIIVLGFTCGGITRGIAVSIVVTICALIFTHLQVYHLFLLISITIIASAILSLAGFINGIYAKSFDHISIIPTFVLSPLTYLGGVFYSVNLLPSLWRDISMANPILYIINIFRYSMLGVSDVNVWLAFILLIFLTFLLFIWALYVLNKGSGIKT